MIHIEMLIIFILLIIYKSKKVCLEEIFTLALKHHNQKYK